MARWVALIRGIGPKTHRVMPLKSLIQSCEDHGLANLRSILATGNLIFDSPLPKGELQDLMTFLLQSYELHNPVLLRTPAELAAAAAANPFTEAAATRPNHLLTVFLDRAPTACPDWPGPETLHLWHDALFIDYAAGVGTSKLDPARIERLTGATGTARNWNTLQKLIAAASP